MAEWQLFKPHDELVNDGNVVGSRHKLNPQNLIHAEPPCLLRHQPHRRLHRAARENRAAFGSVG